MDAPTLLKLHQESDELAVSKVILTQRYLKLQMETNEALNKLRTVLYREEAVNELLAVYKGELK